MNTFGVSTGGLAWAGIAAVGAGFGFGFTTTRFGCSVGLTAAVRTIGERRTAIAVSRRISR